MVIMKLKPSEVNELEELNIVNVRTDADCLAETGRRRQLTRNTGRGIRTIDDAITTKAIGCVKRSRLSGRRGAG